MSLVKILPSADLEAGLQHDLEQQSDRADDRRSSTASDGGGEVVLQSAAQLDASEEMDYAGVTLPDIVTIVRDKHRMVEAFAIQVRKSTSVCLTAAWRAGRALNAAKVKVVHGGWLTWLKEEVPELGQDQAHRYMRLAREIPHVRNLELFGSLSEAYRYVGILTGDKTPSGARSVATAITERGAAGVLSRIRSFGKRLAKSRQDFATIPLSPVEVEHARSEIDKVVHQLLEFRKSLV